MELSKVTLDQLTTTSVSVARQKYYVSSEGIEYPLGEPWRRAYYNDEEGIADLKAELEEPYLSVVLKMWGVTR